MSTSAEKLELFLVFALRVALRIVVLSSVKSCGKCLRCVHAHEFTIHRLTTNS